MPAELATFRKPNIIDRLFNRLFGILVLFGLALPHNYLVQVRGRKTGKLYSTPIDLLKVRDKRYLVAPRGRTQWVRNAEAAGEVTLKRAFIGRKYRVRLIPEAERPPLLKTYLDRYRLTVQRYFPVRAGSPPDSFASIAGSYPVFELTPMA